MFWIGLAAGALLVAVFFQFYTPQRAYGPRWSTPWGRRRDARELAAVLRIQVAGMIARDVQ